MKGESYITKRWKSESVSREADRTAVETRQILKWVDFGWCRSLKPCNEEPTAIRYDGKVFISQDNSLDETGYTPVILAPFDKTLHKRADMRFVPVITEIRRRAPLVISTDCRLLMQEWFTLTGNELALFIMYNKQDDYFYIEIPKQTTRGAEARIKKEDIEAVMLKEKDSVIAGVVQ